MGALSVIEGGGSRQKLKPGQGKVRSVFQAAKSGDRLLVLETLRDRVARDVQSSDTPPRDISSLSKRLMEILEEIEVLKVKQAEERKVGVADAGLVADEKWDGV